MAAIQPALTRRRGSTLAGLYRAYEPGILGVAGLAALIVGWEAAARAGAINPLVLSRPTLIVAVGRQMLADGVIAQHVAVSFREFVAGFALATVVGIPLGFVMGWNRTIEYALDPYLWFLYSAPLVAFFPLFMLWFGLGAPTVIAITFLLTIFPLIVNTMVGIQQVDPSLVRAARAFGASPAEIFWKIALPGALPVVLAGVRLATGRALVGVVIGEIFGAPVGVGFAVRYYGAHLQMSEVFVFLVIIALFGVSLTQGLRYLENRVAAWAGQ